MGIKLNHDKDPYKTNQYNGKYPRVFFVALLISKPPTDTFFFSWELLDAEGSGTPPKINMTVETQPFEDVSPIKHGDFPMSRQFSGV